MRNLPRAGHGEIGPVAIASGKGNARRIVAQRTLAGVTTEELEQGGFVAGLLERLAEAPRWRDIAEETAAGGARGFVCTRRKDGCMAHGLAEFSGTATRRWRLRTGYATFAAQRSANRIGRKRSQDGPLSDGLAGKT